MKVLDLTGERFGKLTVLKRAGVLYSNKQKAWLCACDCGATTVVCTNSLRIGKTVSCGCFRKTRAITHGGARPSSDGRKHSREYNIWCGIKSRCFNPNVAAFKNYGGRGISMYAAWVNDFSEFLADMGPCPDGHCIERRDNNGDYEPGNCVWTTRSAQQMNRRNTLFATLADGSRVTVLSLSERLGIKYQTLARAVKEGRFNGHNYVPRKRSSEGTTMDPGD